MKEETKKVRIRLFDCEDEFGVYEISHSDNEVDIGFQVEEILDKYKELSEMYNIDEFLDLLRMFGFEVSENLSDADYEIYF